MKIGIDLGGSHIETGLIEEDKIVDQIDKNFVNKDRKNIRKVIVETAIQMINKILENNNLTKKDIEIIGIASPGIISKKTIVKATNLSLEEFCLCEALEEALGINTQIRNDAKCAALAEKKYGSLKNYEDAVFVGIGTGIGGAVFLNGQLLEPDRNEGFEIGHMIIEADGRPCSCGKRGCFETYASIRALKQRVTNILGISSDISGQYLRENLLILDNKEVQDEVESFLNYLKIGLGNLIDIFEPEAICLGGSFAYYEGNPILDRLRDKMKEPNTTFSNSKTPEILTAHFKNNAGIIGATI